MKNHFKILLCLILPIGGFSETNECLTEQMARISEQNVLCKWQGKSASAGVDKGFIAQGSYLYWQAKEDGLEYAQGITIAGSPSTEIIASSEIFEPTSKWTSGFQAGIGYIFSARSQWDLFLNWTSFHSEATHSLISADPTLTFEMVRPTWLPFLMGTGASEGAVSWDLKYNIINLTLGRDFFIGKYLSFHPEAGLTGGWITQQYRANYEGFSASNGLFSPIGPTNYQANWGYRAIGIRMGTDAKWHITSQLSFVANGFLSLLYGKYKLRERFQGAFVPTPPLLIHETIHLRDNYNRLRPNLETELGLCWQSFFNQDKRRFLLGAYYGFSYWIHQNIMVNEFVVLNQNFNSFVTDLPTLGDLQFQGLRIEAGLDF